MPLKRACDACHSRKIQCEPVEGNPNCDWCAHHDLQCKFDRARGRRKGVAKPRAKEGSGRDISDRLGRLEDTLAQAIGTASTSSNTPGDTTASSTSTPTSQSRLSASSNDIPWSVGEQISEFESRGPPNLFSPSASSPAVSLGQIHFAGYHLGQVSSHDGIPLFSAQGQEWIRERTGEDAGLQELGALGARHRIHPSSMVGSSAGPLATRSFDLPPRHLVEECLGVFLTCGFRQAFPVVDPVLFRETIRIAYEPWNGPPSLEPGGPSERPLAVDPDENSLRAQSLMSEMLQDATLTSLQALFMLTMHQTFSGRLQSATMFHAVACRTCFILGGHTSAAAQPVSVTGRTEIEIRSAAHLRTMFWLCYCIDKEIAFRSGQPPFIADENADLTLPVGYVEFQNSGGVAGALPPFDDIVIPQVPGDLRLSILKAKTFRLLYSVEAQKKLDTEFLRDIRELDAELESWRLSLALPLRPSLSIPKNFRLGPEIYPLSSMQLIITHLEYHYLLATIHRASGRCRPWPTSNPADQEQLSVSVLSSLDLSVEASRSTLFYLRAAVHGLADEVFWVVVFYPISAITTIFFNILMNPLRAEAKEDISLLLSATDIVRRLPIRRLTTHEIVHIKMVNDFIDELVRLGKSAIRKAELENGQS